MDPLTSQLKVPESLGEALTLNPKPLNPNPKA